MNNVTNPDGTIQGQTHDGSTYQGMLDKDNMQKQVQGPINNGGGQDQQQEEFEVDINNLLQEQDNRNSKQAGYQLPLDDGHESQDIGSGSGGAGATGTGPDCSMGGAFDSNREPMPAGQATRPPRGQDTPILGQHILNGQNKAYGGMANNAQQIPYAVNDYKDVRSQPAQPEEIGDNENSCQPSARQENTARDQNQKVQNLEDDGSGFFITGINTGEQMDDEGQGEQVQVRDEEEEDTAIHVDAADFYRHVAVVDCSKAFSNQECVLVSEKQKSITYLNVSNQVSFKFDSLITSHDQVKHLTDRLIHKFIYPKKGEKDKIVLNVADPFNCNNNAGFNLTNFKIKFINQFFQDVINDYEKSIIGTFSKTLLEKLQMSEKLKDKYELYFTITKFEKDIGFSLIHQEMDKENQEINQSFMDHVGSQMQQEAQIQPNVTHIFQNQGMPPNAQMSQMSSWVQPGAGPQCDATGNYPTQTVTSGGPETNQNANQMNYDDVNGQTATQLSTLNVNNEAFTKEQQIPKVDPSQAAVQPYLQVNNEQYVSDLDGGDEVMIRGQSPTAEIRQEIQRNQRRANLTKHGVIPEFIKISEIYQVYTAFTQANLKNSILQQKQARKQAIIFDEPVALKETELKEDILVIQFKLVNKETYKTANTFSFINAPLSKIQDNNIGTLIEILNKFKKPVGPNAKKQKQNDFIPYNKSILTRVIAQQLQKNNILVLSHYSKVSIDMHFKHSNGPAKNIFSQIDQLFGDKPGIIIRKKLNSQQALKVLQQKFKRETIQIFGQLNQFREGAKSIEVYAQQTASQLPKSYSVKGSVTPTMFQQILQFLRFKDEIIQGYEEGSTQSLFMRQMPTHDIQKVIFDKNYVKFTKQRQKLQQAQEAVKQNDMTGLGGPSGTHASTFTHGYSSSGTKCGIPPLGPTQAQTGQFQMNRLQYVQYECIKTELKEEYDKRVNFLHKRIEKRQAQMGPYQDAHLILLQNTIGDINQNAKKIESKSRSNNLGAGDKNGFSLPGMNTRNSVAERKGYIQQNKTVRGSYCMENRKASRGTSNMNKLDTFLQTTQQAQEKEQYYKFYLDSAQKAIEMMRKQHKSASLMRISQENQVTQQIQNEKMKYQNFQQMSGQSNQPNSGAPSNVVNQDMINQGITQNENVEDGKVGLPPTGKRGQGGDPSFSYSRKTGGVVPVQTMKACSTASTNKRRAKGGRVLEPIQSDCKHLMVASQTMPDYAQQEGSYIVDDEVSQAPPKGALSGGNTAMDQMDLKKKEFNKSTNFQCFANPQMKMINENACDAIQIANKPNSAAHIGKRHNATKEIGSRVHTSTKQSTQLQSGVQPQPGHHRQASDSYGFRSGTSYNPSRSVNRANRQGTNVRAARSVQRSFKPLRDQGKIGTMANSNVRARQFAGKYENEYNAQINVVSETNYVQTAGDMTKNNSIHKHHNLDCQEGLQIGSNQMPAEEDQDPNSVKVNEKMLASNTASSGDFVPATSHHGLHQSASMKQELSGCEKKIVATQVAQSQQHLLNQQVRRKNTDSFTVTQIKQQMEVIYHEAIMISGGFDSGEQDSNAITQSVVNGGLDLNLKQGFNDHGKLQSLGTSSPYQNYDSQTDQQRDDSPVILVQDRGVRKQSDLTEDFMKSQQTLQGKVNRVIESQDPKQISINSGSIVNPNSNESQSLLRK